jgi:hypothetical protein
VAASAESRTCRVADSIAKPDPNPQYSWLDMMDGLQRDQSRPPPTRAPQSETTVREPHRSCLRLTSILDRAHDEHLPVETVCAIRKEGTMNRGIIGLIIGVLVIIVLVLVILRLT